MHNFYIFFLCYFHTIVVLRIFQYIPKSLFEIKLVGTHFKFIVALRFCHIYFFILELVFIDSTSYLDKHNLRFFLLVASSVAGGLPLGNFIAFHVFLSTEREN